MKQQITTEVTSEQPSQQVDARVALQQGFVRIRPQIQAVLPAHITLEKFERVAMTAINNNPDLLVADRRSFFNSCQKAAQDGLLPDGREGALVIFKDYKTNKEMVQWMPMVFGIIKKLRQSGEIASITAHIVYAKEIADGMFTYVLGDDERIEHRRYFGADRGDPVLVYAVCQFKDGSLEREVLTLADVEKARAVSRTGKKEHSPWVKWWDEMARKTAIRKLSKRLPLSADDRRVIDREDDNSDFAKQRKEASTLLDKAREQIGAPVAAIAPPAEESPPLEGEIVDTETGEIIDEGDKAEREAAVKKRDVSGV